MKLDNIATASMTQMDQNHKTQKGEFDAQVDATLTQLKAGTATAPESKDSASMQEANNEEA